MGTREPKSERRRSLFRSCTRWGRFVTRRLEDVEVEAAGLAGEGAREEMEGCYCRLNVIET